MKKLLSLLILIVLAGPVYGFTVDPNRYEGFDLIHSQSICQGLDYFAQWGLVDSNDGILDVNYVELPAGAIGDSNGLISYTPQETGIFYFKVLLYCNIGDPNACVWPEIRTQAVAIEVKPSKQWETKFIPFAVR